VGGHHVSGLEGTLAGLNRRPHLLGPLPEVAVSAGRSGSGRITFFVVLPASSTLQRLKVLNACAMGKAVVSTSVGCEGFAAVDGNNILIRDNRGEFADAVLRTRQPATPSRPRDTSARHRGAPVQLGIDRAADARYLSGYCTWTPTDILNR
jgi:glycosyl transferase family 1